MEIISTLKTLFPDKYKKLIKEKSGAPSQELSFKKLKSLGYSPKIALDIGAYEGQWAMNFRAVFPDCAILMIEGQQEKENMLKSICLKQENIDYQIALLGSSRQIVNFNIYETASSVFEEYNKTEAKIEQRELIMLDDLISGTKYTNSDFIKIDTQGYELEILKGGENTLCNASAVLLEVSMINIYKNSPLVHDVLNFMSQRNFFLYDICSLITRPLDKALYQSDFLFVKNDSFLRNSKKWS